MRRSPAGVATALRRRSTHLPSRIWIIPAPFVRRSCLAAADSSQPVIAFAAVFHAMSAPDPSKMAIPSCASAKRRCANGSSVRRCTAGDDSPLPRRTYPRSVAEPAGHYFRIGHTFRVKPIALVVVGLQVVVGSVAFAAAPPEDAEIYPSLQCVQRIDVPFVQNVMEAKWSPDSTTLALVWFAQLPSSRSVTGYREQEIIDTLDLKSGQLRPLGVGDEVDWSGSGAFASYWGPNADELRVATKDGAVVARLVPTIPRIAWVGDGLLFVEKTEIREWREGAVRTIATLDDRFVPKYPRDDLYFSGDGTRFTLTRYSPDGTLQRYLRLTRTGQVTPLDANGARLLEWAPTGATLMVRYLDRIDIRDLDGEDRSTQLATRDQIHGWAPDGKTLLLGRVSPTIPAGNAYDAFRVWDAKTGPPIATLPNLLGARTFSPDGKYFVGASRNGRQTTRLEVYRCGGTRDGARPDPSAPARLAA